MKKRSAKWAVVREQAPVMPWDEGEPMNPILADALRRVVAIRGTVYVAYFYLDVMELFDREVQAQGEGAPLTEEELQPIITQHYHELVELHGEDYAQRFVRLWLMLSGYLDRRVKGAIARTALRRQLARVSRS